MGKVSYNDVLEINKFVDEMLAANPIGKYHRMEDIYDDVLVLARVDAEKAYAADGKKKRMRRTAKNGRKHLKV